MHKMHHHRQCHDPYDILVVYASRSFRNCYSNLPTVGSSQTFFLAIKRPSILSHPNLFNITTDQTDTPSYPTFISCRSLFKSRAMQPDEVTGIHCLVPANPPLFSAHFGMTPNNMPSFQFNRFNNPLGNFQMIPPQVQEFSLQSSCLSNNSTSDEADEQQLNLINERKQRRMISNRESARRSRMRKQKHLDELWSQVVWLRNENHQLIDKLNHMSESQDRVLQENAQLKEQAGELRQMLTEMQLNSSFSDLKDLDDLPSNSAYLRADSSDKSVSSSCDLLG
uniref:Basic leucine zipper 43 n=1 Tax=Rhizophora mucronata TaxID=61149 RepID=A0A2P2PQ76_RHIMU